MSAQLPAGVAAGAHIIAVTLLVRNAFGAVAAAVSANVTVTWDPDVLANPAALVSSQAGAASAALLNGDTDAALRTVTGLGALLNAAAPAASRRRLLQAGQAPTAGAQGRAVLREGLLETLSGAASVLTPTPQSLAQIAQGVSSVAGRPTSSPLRRRRPPWRCWAAWQAAGAS